MKVLVINGTEVKGCTYQMKEILLGELKDIEEMNEYYLPGDFPHFCIGCKNCFIKGEEFCPHADDALKIWNSIIEADLLIFAYPVYVMGVPGQLKALIDHFGCHWIAHRPKKKCLIKLQ